MQPKENFLGISYDVWCETVRNYFEAPTNRKNNYLQWYPFIKSGMKEKLLSNDFYTRNIESGYIFFDEQVIEINNNYLQ